MQPTLGMFLSRDPWSGDETRPGSMNGFEYVEGNPVNLTDPSGQSISWPTCMWPNRIVVKKIRSWTGRFVEYTECVGPGGMSPIFGTTTTMGGDPASEALKILVVYGVYCVSQLLQQQVQTQANTWAELYYARKEFTEPKRQPIPFPWPQPTETPQPERKHIALGLSENNYLTQFFVNLSLALKPQNIRIYLAAMWDLAGLSDVPAQGSYFESALGQAATRAEHIHFNLEGITGDPNDFANRLGNHGMTYPFAYTAIELYHIKTSGLCAKTTFYEHGSTDLTPSSRWGEICGGQ